MSESVQLESATVRARSNFRRSKRLGQVDEARLNFSNVLSLPGVS